jgi:transcription elongation factor Elf1
MLGLLSAVEYCDYWYKSRYLIQALSEPIDVYSEWIDACELANNQETDKDAQEPSKEVLEDSEDDFDV